MTCLNYLYYRDNIVVIHVYFFFCYSVTIKLYSDILSQNTIRFVRVYSSIGEVVWCCLLPWIRGDGIDTTCWGPILGDHFRALYGICTDERKGALRTKKSGLYNL